MNSIFRFQDFASQDFTFDFRSFSRLHHTYKISRYFASTRLNYPFAACEQWNRTDRAHLSLGSYHRCKYLPGNEMLSGYRMCVLDVLDSTREFTVITQGICLPDVCDGKLIEALIKQLVDCKNGTSLLGNYTSKVQLCGIPAACN